MEKNYKELRAFLKSKKMRLQDYANNVLCVKPNTLTCKLIGRLSFTTDDIIRTINYFHLSPSQVDKFFFHEHLTK